MRTFRENQAITVRDFVTLKKGGFADTVIDVMNSLVSSCVLDNNFNVRDKVAFNNLWNEYCN